MKKLRIEAKCFWEEPRKELIKGYKALTTSMLIITIINLIINYNQKNMLAGGINTITMIMLLLITINHGRWEKKELRKIYGLGKEKTIEKISYRG